jgi:hypothetical protein
MKKVYSSKDLDDIINKNIEYLENTISIENKIKISDSEKIDFMFVLSKA